MPDLGSGEDQNTKSRLQAYTEAYGEDDKRITVPEPRLRYLFECLLEVGLFKHTFNGIEAINYTDVKHWADLTQSALTIWSFKELVNLSREYVRFYHKASNPYLTACGHEIDPKKENALKLAGTYHLDHD